MAVTRTSVTLEKRHEDFLQEFTYQYWKKTGKRVSTSAVIRALIEHLESVAPEYQIVLIQGVVETKEVGNEKR